LTRRIGLALFVFALAAGFLGCSQSTQPEGTAAPVPVHPIGMIDPCGEPQVVTLYAGQFIDAGFVTVSNDAQTLSVEIQTAPGWFMTESHVAVAHTLEDLPQTGSGNPQVGHFDFAAVHNPRVATYTYLIDIAEYGYQLGDPLVVAVHAAVVRVNDGGAIVQRETAWGDGLDFPGNNWATYLEYTVQQCVIEPQCEITVLYPNGGESFCLGDDTMIGWTQEGISCGDFVKIELLQRGELCLTLAESVPNSGSFVWTDVQGCAIDDLSMLAVRVTDLTSGAFDESDGPFELFDCNGGGNGGE